MTSPDLTASNIDKIAELFPSVVTETVDADGNPVRAVDFDLLRQELSDHVVEGPQERYQLDWPGKRAAAFAANAPIAKTLRPVREESVDFDTTKNLFIEGDNLDALKLLQESYLGKVKLIYIDPPYNTGNDFVYDDDFAETTAEYLAAVRPGGRARRAARREPRVERSIPLGLAQHDVPATEAGAEPADRRRGHLRLSIDDNEVAQPAAAAATRSSARRTSSGRRRLAEGDGHADSTTQSSSADHDYMLVLCARTRVTSTGHRLGRRTSMQRQYENPDDDPRGPWSCETDGLATTPVRRPNLHYRPGRAQRRAAATPAYSEIGAGQRPRRPYRRTWIAG